MNRRKFLGLAGKVSLIGLGMSTLLKNSYAGIMPTTKEPLSNSTSVKYNSEGKNVEIKDLDGDDRIDITIIRGKTPSGEEWKLIYRPDVSSGLRENNYLESWRAYPGDGSSHEISKREVEILQEIFDKIRN